MNASSDTFEDRHPNHLVRINKLGITCVETHCDHAGEFISWQNKVAEEPQEPSQPREPDGWAIIHHRASGSGTLYFGPFNSLDEATAFRRQPNKRINGSIVPLWRTVDWTRR